MMIKVGVWRSLTFLEKADLLVHFSVYNEVGNKLKEKEEKNKSIHSKRA